MSAARLSVALMMGLATVGCHATGEPGTVEAWIARDAAPLVAGTDVHLPDALVDARVVGLGEATHGQHESFAWKRAITMQLIRAEGVRVVAYEASASTAVACDDYIAGRSDDLAAAMKGLSMVIWRVEENADLLRDLRAWNQQATPADRVRFIGIDVQNLAATADRLRAALGPSQQALGERAVAVAAEFDASLEKLMTGERGAYEAALSKVAALLADVDVVASGEVASREEVILRRQEFLLTVNVPSSPGARDRGMAELLLAQLDRFGPNTKAVVWAHNLHVTRSPTNHFGSAEPGMGGVLGASIGPSYYALGFFFGEGEFASLDRDESGWGFRTYAVDPPPAAALEASFMAGDRGPVLIDLRRAPSAEPIRAWLNEPHGHRTFGGYGVPADAREISRDATRLTPTMPGRDYDGILFLPRTTPSTPLPPARRL
jgi:erythromycin esterase